MALMKSGEHIVSSRSIFGATQQLFGTILARFGIETTFIDSADSAAFAAALRPNTRLLFIETPSNPLTEVLDIAALAAVAHAGGVLLVVDNCFCSPALQQPLKLGADLVIHSATKYLDGQGRVLGGAVCGPKALTDEVFKFLRTAGPTISPFNAWVILKGMETLSLRMKQQSANALELAQWLEQQPQVARVYYPGLSSHPQHALAMRQQKSGAILNISSLAAIAGHHMVTYEVSKMAVNRLTTVVASGNAKHNVRCNVIMPGLLDTPMAITGIAAASGKPAEQLRVERSARVPMGRMGTAWDTAYAALFLCSDEARFITGAVLPVDGGTSVTIG